MPLWSVEDWRVRIAFSYSALGVWRPVKLRGYGGRTKSKPFLSSYPNQRHLSSFIARSLRCLSAAILMLLLISVMMTDNLGPLSHLVKWGQKVVTTPKTNQLLMSSLKCVMLAFSYLKLLLLLSGDVETNPGPPEPDTPTLEDAMVVLAPLANQWQLVGKLLDIPYHLLQAIAKDYTTDVDRLQKMFKTWLDEDNPRPSWRKLAAEVEEIDGSIALKVAQQYQILPEAEEEPSDEDLDAAEKRRRFEAYQQALEETLKIELKYLRLILVGVPRAGKTSMKRRLVGEEVDPCEPSTGVSEFSEVIVTQDLNMDTSMTVVDISEPKSKWTALGGSALKRDAQSSAVTDLDRELLMIYQFTNDKWDEQHSASTADQVQQEKREGDEHSITVDAGTKEQPPSSNTVEGNSDQSHAQDGGPRLNEETRIDNESHDERNVPRSGKTDAGTPDAATETKKQLETPTETGKDVPSRKNVDMAQIAKVFDAFNNVMQKSSAEKDKLKVVLEKTLLLNLVDTGGQLAFLEMLPLLTVGPALYLIFFKLNERIKARLPYKERSKVRYCPDDGNEFDLEKESYTTQEVIHQVVSSIACCSHASKPEKHKNSTAKDISFEEIASKQCEVAMLVGTHKNEPEVNVDEVNKHLQEELGELFERGFLLKYAAEELAFTVDNKEDGEQEIDKLRGRLVQVIKREFEVLPIPASWFMFSIMLRRMAAKENKPILTLQECEEIGRRLKMTDVNDALWFLHHCIGIVMHYDNVEGLENLVICDPHIIFNLVTELIAKTFTVQPVENDVKDFKEKGQFKKGDIKKILKSMELHHILESDITPEQLVKLLEHRNIIAEISPTGSASSTNDRTEYFMPAVLPPAEDEEELSLPPSVRNPAPVMIHFTCGIVPVGVFCATVADLVARVEPPRWTLTKPSKNPSKNIILRRNRVTFRVSWYGVRYHVTLIATPKHYAIHLAAIDTVWKPTTICNHVLETVCGALDRVINKMNHICDLIPLSEKNLYQIGFRCPLVHDPGVSEHMVVNEPSSSKPCSKSVVDTWISYLKDESSMKCLKEESVKDPDPPLSDQLECGRYRCWFDEKTKFLQVPVPCITKHPCKLETVSKGKDVKFSISAEGIGSQKYQWVKDEKDITPSKYEGSTTHTLRLTSVEREHEGSYWCVVSNKAGNTTSEKAELVVVTEKPDITEQPSKLPPVGKGKEVTFKISAEGRGRLSYQWFRDGNDITDTDFKVKKSTRPTLRLTSVEPKHEGLYWCVVSNEVGSTESEKEKLVVVTEKPDITEQPSKLLPLGKGKEVTFTVSADGKGTLTYQWVKDGKDITDIPSKCEGSTSPTLRLTSVERKHEGLYWCVVTNEAGPTESKKEELVVVTEEPEITEQPSKRPPGPVGKGKEVTFTVSAEGRGHLTYQWFKCRNDCDIPSKCKGSTSPTLRLTSVEREDEGLYWCVVSNEAGTSRPSEKAQLVIRKRWHLCIRTAFACVAVVCIALCIALCLPFLPSIVGPKLPTLPTNQRQHTPTYTKPSLYEEPTLYQLTNLKKDGSTEALNIPQRIAADYQLFGTQLLSDVYGNEMKAIEKGRDVDEINMEVFCRWLNGKGKHPITWKTLIDTLNDIELAVLAKQIKDAMA